MQLDIRIPVGLMFSIIGVALIAFGASADPAIYRRSLGINIDLWWGLALLVFGASLLFLGWSSTRRSSGGSAGQHAGTGRPGIPKDRHTHTPK